MVFLKNRYKVGIKASPAYAVASLKQFWNSPLEALFLTNWMQKWKDLVFSNQKRGMCVGVSEWSSLRVELIKEGNFDENIMGDEMKALVSTPE